MKKRLLSLVLVIAMLFSLALPVFAAPSSNSATKTDLENMVRGYINNYDFGGGVVGTVEDLISQIAKTTVDGILGNTDTLLGFVTPLLSGMISTSLAGAGLPITDANVKNILDVIFSNEFFKGILDAQIVKDILAKTAIYATQDALAVALGIGGTISNSDIEALVQKYTNEIYSWNWMPVAFNDNSDYEAAMAEAGQAAYDKAYADSIKDAYDFAYNAAKWVGHAMADGLGKAAANSDVAKATARLAGEAARAVAIATFALNSGTYADTVNPFHIVSFSDGKYDITGWQNPINGKLPVIGNLLGSYTTMESYINAMMALEALAGVGGSVLNFDMDAFTKKLPEIILKAALKAAEEVIRERINAFIEEIKNRINEEIQKAKDKIQDELDKLEDKAKKIIFDKLGKITGLIFDAKDTYNDIKRKIENLIDCYNDTKDDIEGMVDKIKGCIEDIKKLPLSDYKKDALDCLESMLEKALDKAAKKVVVCELNRLFDLNLNCNMSWDEIGDAACLALHIWAHENEDKINAKFDCIQKILSIKSKCGHFNLPCISKLFDRLERCLEFKYTDGTIIKEPTCMENGVKRHYCIVNGCPVFYDEVIPASCDYCACNDKTNCDCGCDCCNVPPVIPSHDCSDCCCDECGKCDECDGECGHACCETTPTICCCADCTGCVEDCGCCDDCDICKVDEICCCADCDECVEGCGCCDDCDICKVDDENNDDPSEEEPTTTTTPTSAPEISPPTAAPFVYQNVTDPVTTQSATTQFTTEETTTQSNTESSTQPSIEEPTTAEPTTATPTTGAPTSAPTSATTAATSNSTSATTSADTTTTEEEFSINAVPLGTQSTDDEEEEEFSSNTVPLGTQSTDDEEVKENPKTGDVSAWLIITILFTGAVGFAISKKIIKVK